MRKLSQCEEDACPHSQTATSRTVPLLAPSLRGLRWASLRWSQTCSSDSGSNGRDLVAESASQIAAASPSIFLGRDRLTTYSVRSNHHSAHSQRPHGPNVTSTGQGSRPPDFGVRLLRSFRRASFAGGRSATICHPSYPKKYPTYNGPGSRSARNARHFAVVSGCPVSNTFSP